MAIFGAKGTRLYSKKLRFDYITLPEAPQIGDWLRGCGGCCRAYTRPDRPNYCTTCVLQDDTSRTERYCNALRRTHLAPPHRTQMTADMKPLILIPAFGLASITDASGTTVDIPVWRYRQQPIRAA